MYMIVYGIWIISSHSAVSAGSPLGGDGHLSDLVAAWRNIQKRQDLSYHYLNLRYSLYIQYIYIYTCNSVLVDVVSVLFTEIYLGSVYR